MITPDGAGQDHDYGMQETLFAQIEQYRQA